MPRKIFQHLRLISQKEVLQTADQISPVTMKTTHFSANVAFTKLPLQEFAVSLWHLLQKRHVAGNYSSPSLSLHRESIGLAVIPGKSDIVEAAGFTTASDIFRVSLGFLSEITEEPFSVHPPHT